MTTLLLRLEGPMQSWGTQSRFSDRDTGLEPSKSGVIGLICASLGRSRNEDISDLAALRMGVRVDAPGTMKRDYQTAGGRYPRYDARGKLIGESKEATISPRYYLADASFIVGLEGDAVPLQHIDRALEQPVWQLYLGRKAFVPSLPLRLPDGEGIRERPLKDALMAPGFSDLGERERRRTGQVRLVMETDEVRGTELRQDVPLSFAQRRFAARHVLTSWEKIS